VLSCALHRIDERKTELLFVGEIQRLEALVFVRCQLVQPGASLLWLLAPQHTLWAAVTRAVRPPSRVEHDLSATSLLDPRTPTFGRAIGNGTFVSEKLLAYELGYRRQPTSRLFLDITAFYNRYTDLLSLEPGTPFTEATPPPAHLIVPLFIRNGLHGEGYGVELAADWQPFDWWRVSGEGLIVGYRYAGHCRVIG